jgi:hypothetical protein
MSIFDDRERAFEQAFINRQEAQFRALALRNRLLGEWAAQQIGLRGSACEAYVDDIASRATFAPVDEPLIAKMHSDLEAHGIAGAEALVRAKMSEFLTQATDRLHARGA